MLGNEKFISKAPEAKINEEKAKFRKIYTNDGTGKRKTCRTSKISPAKVRKYR